MDIVVTVPLSFGLEKWCTEGDCAGDPATGTEYAFSIGNKHPHLLSQADCERLGIEPCRVYVVYNRKLRGYAPLVRVERTAPRQFALIRAGNAVAVTIKNEIFGFRGYRYAWWDRKDEIPFPDWRKP